MMRLILSIYFVCFYFSIASAQSNSINLSAEDLGKSWEKVFQTLEEQGVQKIGEFDLSKFRQNSKKVTWHLNHQKAPSIITGGRPSAYYLVDSKEVYISNTISAEDLPALPNLELHEAMGATGLNDHHYTPSTALQILNEIKDPETLQKLLDLYGKTIFHEDNLKSQSLEGGTSIGGGGDITTLFIKTQVLQEILKTTDGTDLNLLKEYPWINFEPIQSPSINVITVEYKLVTIGPYTDTARFSKKSKETGFEEYYTIYVPLHLWQAGGLAKKSVLEDVKRKVSTLLLTDIENRTDLDTGALKIRKSRLKHPPQGGNKYDSVITMMSPQQLPISVLPRKPGDIYFTCEFTKNGQPQGKTIKNVTLGHAGSSAMYMENGDRGPMGAFHYNSDGIIDALAIGRRDKWSAVKENLESHVDAKVSSKISGYGHLSFSCKRID